MSHIVTIRTQILDEAAAAAACHRLGLPPPQHREVQLFSGEARGLAVELPGWKYPVVCDLTTGHVRLDNFEGRWGAQHELDRFLQAYAAERAKLAARKKGYSVSEERLRDGSIKLTIQVSGGAA